MFHLPPPLAIADAAMPFSPHAAACLFSGFHDAMPEISFSLPLHRR
jgi:hypothetical protein